MQIIAVTDEDIGYWQATRSNVISILIEDTTTQYQIFVRVAKFRHL
jgi:hypothetical protein